MSAVSAEQVKRFQSIFSGRMSAYGQYHIVPEKKVKTLSEPVVPELYLKHLLGEGPFLGVIMIREDNTCLFGAIDIDDDGIDHDELEAKVVAHNLPLVVCRSKSGGAHCYLFLREPIPAEVVVDALKKFRQVLGHEKNSNGTPVEIFPKQVKLSLSQTGNWINLPYYDHENTNRYAITGGRKLGLDEFFEHAVRRSTGEHGLMEWADPALGPFSDGPPCLQNLHSQGFPEGTRNNGLLNVGMFYKASNPDNWKDDLREYNNKLGQPLEETELRQVMKNLDHHDYVYTCKQYPLESVCKKKECKKQRFGIAFFGKMKRLSALPELTNLVKILTDPARYKVTVNGTVIPCSIDQVLRAELFAKLVFERMNMVLEPPKPSEWRDVVRELTTSIKEEDAPAEAGDKGLLLVYMMDFAGTRHKSDSLDDCLLGRAAIENGRVYFRGIDLMGFLQRRQFRRYDMNELYTILHDMAGLQTETRVLKGAETSLWSVPEPTDEQSEPFDHPVDNKVRIA